MTDTFGTTKRQAQAFQFIQGYITKHGFSPSYQDIMDSLGIKSRGHCYNLVAALVDRGLIRHLYGRARSITIAQPAEGGAA